MFLEGGVHRPANEGRVLRTLISPTERSLLAVLSWYDLGNIWTLSFPLLRIVVKKWTRLTTHRDIVFPRCEPYPENSPPTRTDLPLITLCSTGFVGPWELLFYLTTRETGRSWSSFLNSIQPCEAGQRFWYFLLPRGMFMFGLTLQPSRILFLVLTSRRTRRALVLKWSFVGASGLPRDPCTLSATWSYRCPKCCAQQGYFFVSQLRFSSLGRTE